MVDLINTQNLRDCNYRPFHSKYPNSNSTHCLLNVTWNFISKNLVKNEMSPSCCFSLFSSYVCFILYQYFKDIYILVTLGFKRVNFLSLFEVFFSTADWRLLIKGKTRVLVFFIFWTCYQLQGIRPDSNLNCWCVNSRSLKIIKRIFEKCGWDETNLFLPRYTILSEYRTK